MLGERNNVIFCLVLLNETLLLRRWAECLLVELLIMEKKGARVGPAFCDAEGFVWNRFTSLGHSGEVRTPEQRDESGFRSDGFK